jgi:hypothetical protein
LLKLWREQRSNQMKNYQCWISSVAAAPRIKSL